jgi:penicillin amidase
MCGQGVVVRRYMWLLAVCMMVPYLSGCFSLFARLPPPSTVDDRIASVPQEALPLREPVTIRWSDDFVPFIEAQSQHDAAVALGVVHAHARLGQMELLRRVSRGELALGAGPIATKIDKALRILDLGRAAPQIWQGMAPEGREWLLAYCAGINATIAQKKSSRPIEHRVMNYPLEEWTPIDVLVLGRLAAVDVNWIAWLGTLLTTETPQREAFQERMDSMVGVPGFGVDDPLHLAQMLAGLSRSGSNAVVVHGSRSASGTPLLASDPHLGIFAPSIWFIVGWSTPEQQITGISVPGLPFIAIGRNEHIAWGGTNMRTWSSDLYRLSEQDLAAATIEEEPVQVRWWFDSTVQRRVTPWGPVISDVSYLSEKNVPPLALRWLGHDADADEFSALIRMGQATSIEAAHQSLRGYRVSGQTMLLADTNGDIGQLLMTSLPKRDPASDGIWLRSTEDPEHAWQGVIDAVDLPLVKNPAAGWIGSANNPPVQTLPRLGYAASSARIRRMHELLGQKETISIQDLQAVQQDIVSPTARALAEVLVQHAPISETTHLLTGWDGSFAADSRAALAMEWVTYHLVEVGYSSRYGDDVAMLIARLPFLREWLHEDITADPATWQPTLAEAVELTDADLLRHDDATWGDFHRLRIAHPFVNLPFVGGKYRFAEYGIGGTGTVLNKAATPLSNQAHHASLGASARFVCDLGDLDSNWMVILGGQDGQLNSEANWNQVERWQAGEYLTLPLSPTAVEAHYEHVMQLHNSASAAGTKFARQW